MCIDLNTLIRVNTAAIEKLTHTTHIYRLIKEGILDSQKVDNVTFVVMNEKYLNLKIGKKGGNNPKPKD